MQLLFDVTGDFLGAYLLQNIPTDAPVFFILFTGFDLTFPATEEYEAQTHYVLFPVL